ncbi:MAG: radical SAM protein [Candidatus Staskawiczbacteria bacterium]
MKTIQVLRAVHERTVKKWKSCEFIPIEDRKFKILLDDGHSIEAGVFTMESKGNIEHHACISSQVGCKFACRMCSSGKNGFLRNLTAQEILGEIRLLEEGIDISRLNEILFMGIGEPLDNYDNFVAALKQLTHYSDRLSFATVGLPDKLISLSKEDLPRLKMAWISLHASDDIKRSSIMPVNRVFKISDVLDSAKRFAMATKVRVWINYLLFQGFNDFDHDIELLVKLMEGTETYFRVQISEPNNDLPDYKAASGAQLELFERKLKDLGLKNDTFCFKAAGKDVQAGCGEFVYLAK